MAGYLAPAVTYLPPFAEVRPKTLSIHGDARVDEYHWMRDRNDPTVLAYLEAENQYAAEMMRDTESLQEALIAEMRARFKQSDVNVPQRTDDYFYYYRSAREQQYPVYCRKHQSLDAPEEVVLDVNEIAAGHEYIGVGAFRVSPDHSLLAYSIDTSGGESFHLLVKDLQTGELLPDTRKGLFGNVEWSADGKALFYIAIDESTRPFELRRFELGTPQGQDAVVYREPDASFYVSVRKTKTKKYILIEIESLSTSEVRFFEADGSWNELGIFDPRRAGVEYAVDHQEGSFIVASDCGESRRRLFRTPVETPGSSNWTEVPIADDLDVDEIEVFRDYLVIGGRKEGFPHVLVIDAAGASHFLEFEEETYTVDVMGNPEYESDQLRLRYSSLVTPHSILDYHMGERTFKLLKRLEVASGYDRDRYQTELVKCRSADDTIVPMSLAYRKDLFSRDGRNPAVLYGYGAYGETSDPEFSLERLSLLDRGFVFAIAHTRGGGEFGDAWHEAGRLLNKKKTFEDFICCAERLVEAGYTSAGRLVADGRSAGGLLVGTVINLRPELFKAAIVDVPFVDVINTMLDPSLPLTEAEFDEWGDPSKPEFYSYIKGYAPYEGVREQDYPNLLVTTSIADARVPFWEPAKWVARLRARKTDDNLVLLRVLGAGHAGKSGRLDYLHDEALRQAFMFKVLEMVDLDSR